MDGWSSRCRLVYLLLALLPLHALAQDAFLLIPGVPGNSTVDNRLGWFEVIQYSLEVDREAPGTCTLELDVRLGTGAAALAPLIGGVLPADVRLELQFTPTRATFYQAALKGASVVSLTSLYSRSGFVDRLVIRFRQLALSLRSQRPDGSLGPPTMGTVECR